MEKTNAMRILEQHKIPYEVFVYPHEEGICVEGAIVAQLLNENPSQVFKTLVSQGASKQYYVFVIPVDKELDLKKAAKSVKEKSVELVAVKDLLYLTGYIRGGCSPIGMKKSYFTILDLTAKTLPYILCSAGKIGYQVKICPKDLAKVLIVQFFEITR